MTKDGTHPSGTKPFDLDDVIRDALTSVMFGGFSSYDDLLAAHLKAEANNDFDDTLGGSNTVRKDSRPDPHQAPWSTLMTAFDLDSVSLCDFLGKIEDAIATEFGTKVTIDEGLFNSTSTLDHVRNATANLVMPLTAARDLAVKASREATLDETPVTMRHAAVPVDDGDTDGIFDATLLPA